jgi:TolB protein
VARLPRLSTSTPEISPLSNLSKMSLDGTLDICFIRLSKNADRKSPAVSATRNMNTRFLLFALLVLAIHSSLSVEPVTPQRRLVFVRDSNIWTANLDGSKPRKLLKGGDPCISPDGQKVAFTISPTERKEVVRYIAVAELSTGSTKVFKETPSNNCFGPVWSPDGSQILFEIFVENHWRLGLLNGDGSGFRFFELPFRDPGWWSVIWAPDGKSIFCQDLQKICRFDLSGQLLASWEIGKIIPDGDLDSAKRLSVSDDGQRLLINVNMDQEESPKDWAGPPPAIWLFDIPSGKATRLTQKMSYASDACWLNQSEYLLVDAMKNEKTSSLYQASIGGETPRRVIKNAADPSVSAGAR